MVVTKVVVEPSGKTDVMVTGTDVVERLSDDTVLSVASAVGDGESESSSSVVCRRRDECAGQVRGRV